MLFASAALLAAALGACAPAAQGQRWGFTTVSAAQPTAPVASGFATVAVAQTTAPAVWGFGAAPAPASTSPELWGFATIPTTQAPADAPSPVATRR